MSELQILLCGPPEIKTGNQALDLPRKTARALLYYLASQGGPVGREQVLPLFWQDVPDNAARKRLSDTLSRLRAALPDQNILQTSSDFITLDFERIYVDQIDFQARLQKIGRSPWQHPDDEPLPEALYLKLLEAAAIWRKPYFLYGASLPSSESFDRWRIETSRQMELSYGQVMDRLAKHAQASGQNEQALQYLRLALLHDELDDELNYRLMHLLIDMGQHREARRHYKHLESLFQQEFHTTPAKRLVELSQHTRKKARPTGRAQKIPDWKLRSSVPAPFVGRRTILEQLNRYYLRGGGVLVAGESGGGKTRLLQEFTQHLQPAPRLLLATCLPGAGTLPFQPVIEMLRHFISPAEWLALPAVWAAPLRLLFPELSQLRTDLRLADQDANMQASPEQARSRIFEAIRQLILQISQAERLVLCVDDAQWSDEATLATLGYLIERPPFDRQAFMLCATRQEEPNPYLEKLVTMLQHTHRFSILHLAHLNDTDIQMLTRLITGQSPSEQVVQQLIIETGGNPFILLELLRALIETDSPPDLSMPVALPVVASIYKLINSRLEKLQTISRRMLEYAAVIGTDFSPELLESVSRYNEDLIAIHIEELEHRGLIESTTTNQGDLQYKFRHDKIREVILKSISLIRKRVMHKRVASVMTELSNQEAQSGAIAQHYELGGDLSQAFDYWLNAARYARQLYSTVDMQECFLRAEKIIPRCPVLSENQIIDLYSSWTSVSYTLEDVLNIQKINSELNRLGHERSSPLLIGTALSGLGELCFASNQFEEGLAYSNQALLYLERSNNPVMLARAYIRRGAFYYMLNRLDEATNTFQEGLKAIQDAVDIPAVIERSNIRYHLSILSTLMGNPQVGLHYGMLSLADATQCGDNDRRIIAYAALCAARHFMGDAPGAIRDGQAGLDLAHRASAWRFQGYLYSYQAMSLLATGQIDLAIEGAHSAIAIGERYQHDEITALGYQILGDIYSWTRQPDLALEHYYRAAEVSRNKVFDIDINVRIAHTLIRKGHNEGLSQLALASEQAQSSKLGLFWILARVSQLATDLQNHDYDAVITAGEILAQDAQEHHIGTVVLLSQLYRITALFITGQHGPGETLARNTIQQAQQKQNLWIELLARLELHKVIKAAGLPDPAQVEQCKKLLDFLSEHCTIPPHREHIGSFCKSILNALE